MTPRLFTSAAHRIREVLKWRAAPNACLLKSEVDIFVVLNCEIVERGWDAADGFVGEMTLSG